jgi:hypothetical protein
MKKVLMAATAIVAIALLPATAEARSKHKHYRHHRASDANGNQAFEPGKVTSRKTGAYTHVSAKFQPQAQAYIDDLEQNHGATIYYLGGYRRGRCSIGHQHPCGTALDVCQDRRAHVSGAKDCHLPPPATIVRVASAHGLYEGARWCDSDYGHVQLRPSGGHCTPTGWARHVYYIADAPATTQRILVARAKLHHKKRHYAPVEHMYASRELLPQVNWGLQSH